MSKTKSENLAYHLIKLSDDMASVAAEMFDLSKSDDSLAAGHAKELLGAAGIFREWADNASSLSVHYDLPAVFFCRCRDKTCQQRESCLRWLARNQGSGNYGFVSESSMRPACADPNTHCKYFIEPGWRSLRGS